MTFFNSIIIPLTICGLLSCGQVSSQSNGIKKENASLKLDSTEEKIVDSIFKLKEVKERARYIEQQTKGQRHLQIWIEDTPKLLGKKYYWVKVGEDNGAVLVTHFNFYVYPDSMRIMFYDIINDKEITLAKWRQMNNK